MWTVFVAAIAQRVRDVHARLAESGARRRSRGARAGRCGEALWDEKSVKAAIRSGASLGGAAGPRDAEVVPRKGVRMVGKGTRLRNCRDTRFEAGLKAITGGGTTRGCKAPSRRGRRCARTADSCERRLEIGLVDLADTIRGAGDVVGIFRGAPLDRRSSILEKPSWLFEWLQSVKYIKRPLRSSRAPCSPSDSPGLSRRRNTVSGRATGL